MHEPSSWSRRPGVSPSSASAPWCHRLLGALLCLALAACQVVAPGPAPSSPVRDEPATCTDGTLTVSDQGPELEHVTITAPCRVEYDPDAPVLGEQSGRPVVAGLRVVGAGTFSVSCDAVAARQAPDLPAEPWVWVRNVETGRRWDNALRAAEGAHAPPPAEPDCALLEGMSVRETFDVEVGELVDLPVEDAVYEIEVSWGRVRSNTVRVEVVRRGRKP